MEKNNKLLTIDEARSILRIGKNTMYCLVQQGLPSLRVGKQIRIPEDKMLEWIEKMTMSDETDESQKLA